MPENHQSKHHMACMEVWGGNDAVDKNIEMLGLNSWIYSKPFAESDSGGDVYYLSSCATGRIIRLLVADVSGHGKQVQEPANNLKMFMRRYINQINQKRFVKAMNHALLGFAEGGLFATAVVATYFAPTRSLTLTNAGHPPPIYFDKKTGLWRLLKTSENETNKPIDIPLGIMDMSEYEIYEMRLNLGDVVILYTDSLIECRNANGDFLGEDGLCAMLNEIDTEDLEHLNTTILEHLRKLNPDNLKNDDTTLMIFSPNSLFEENYQAPTLKQHLKVMGSILSKIFTKGAVVPFPDLHPSNIGGAMFKFMNKLWGRHLK